MSECRVTIREDERFRVVVGWDDELETFVLAVWDAGELVLSLGERPHEIPTVSELLGRTAPYARIDVATVSALRHAARPLADQARYADPSPLLDQPADTTVEPR